MAVVSTSSNTRPFAFRWKKEQCYLDNPGPNGGTMAKCLAIKQFDSVLPVSLSGELIQYDAWVIPINKNGQQLTIHKGVAVYIVTSILIISDPGPFVPLCLHSNSMLMPKMSNIHIGP